MKVKEHSRISWNSVQPKEITWLWQDRIPFGKLTIFSGDSGLGKTSVALDIAARLTTGRSMPMSNAKPVIGNVLYQSQEDDISDTLLPRCINAGADLSRLMSIDATDLNIDEDCDIIEQHIRETQAVAVFFDPLQSFMGKNADMCRITDIRRLLTNLGGIAARNNCAIIIIAHQTKAQGAKELHRVFGSVDITATARSVLRISADENNPETRIISHIKSSVSRPGAPIAFRIMDNAPILYLGVYDGEGEFEEIPDDNSKTAKVTEVIYSMLRDSPKEAKDIIDACVKLGVSKKTVERVKKDLGILSKRDGVKRIWALP